MTEWERHQKDMIITPLIEQGQSPYQIATNHPELDMPVRIMYTYLDNGLFTARKIDLKRKPKFKPRKCHKTQITNRSVFTNPTYADFLTFLMNRCTKGAVRLVFDHLEKRLETYEFLSLFEYLLTDRGFEFGDPETLEPGIEGSQRTSIYYCDPMRSGQKGGVENAHTMLRMVLPKGTSFEYLTQRDVNLNLLSDWK